MTKVNRTPFQIKQRRKYYNYMGYSKKRKLKNSDCSHSQDHKKTICAFDINKWDDKNQHVKEILGYYL